jgi:hypothetical protein
VVGADIPALVIAGEFGEQRPVKVGVVAVADDEQLDA